MSDYCNLRECYACIIKMFGELHLLSKQINKRVMIIILAFIFYGVYNFCLAYCYPLNVGALLLQSK